MDFDRQLRFFQLQHDRMPEGRFWIPLADLLLRHGRVEEARRLLDEGLTAWPGSISGRWVLARCLEAEGDLEGAREAAATVLALDPGHAGARALQDALTEVASQAWPAPAAAAAEPVEPASPALSVVPDPEPAAAVAEPEPEPAATVPETEPEPVPAPAVAPEPAATPAAAGVGFRQDSEDPAPTFVTRTLADIYLEQGHRDKALQILRQVLAVHPDRDDITARIRAIETGADATGDAPAQDHDEDNRRRFDAWLRREAGGGE